MASALFYRATAYALLLVLAAAEGPVARDYVESLDTFTGHFYKEASSEIPTGNLFVSALSVDVLFALVGYGARGTTKTDIAHSLFLNDIEEAAPSIKNFIEDINNVKGVELQLANKVFVKPSSDGKLDSVVPSYHTIIADIFKSEVQQVDFSTPVITASLINDWVENKTNHLIKNLVDPGALTPATSAVLINAIYFKGHWQHEFDVKDTKSEDFYLADGSSAKVDMMSQQHTFLYNESPELDAKILLLPYKDRRLSMVIFLPNSKDGLGVLENRLLNGTRQFLRGFYRADVTVKIPKFKIETTLNVKSACEKLGMGRVFTPEADLGGILKNENLFVSDAVQKAFIEVNEKGSEAAAATSIILTLSSLQVFKPPVKEFIADHGFYFSLQYDLFTPLFTGSYRTSK